jgi:hypothetical protein
MPYGPAPLPRKTIADAFRSAVGSSATPTYVLARAAGWNGSQLSTYFNAGEVIASPTTVARLHVVAAMVGYDGAIFVEQGEVPVVGT